MAFPAPPDKNGPRMATNRVGGDVDAFCTRCKMELGHTVLAMVGTRPVRVRCNTCQGEHAYRGPPEKKKGTWVPAADRVSKPAVTSWEALLREKDVSRARPYSAKDRYNAEDLLSLAKAADLAHTKIVEARNGGDE